MEERTWIGTPDGVELEVELAGLPSRFGAYLVDFFLLGMLWLLAFLGLLGLWATTAFWEEGSAVAAALFLFGMFLTNWGYAVFWELLLRGQTPGKLVAGLRVIRQDGLPIGVREAILRNLLRAVDMLPPPVYLVGAIAMLVDPRGRRLGDLVAGTLVVRESLGEARGTRAGAAWADRAEKGQARQAVRLAKGTLSPRQMAVIEQYLERRHQLEPERRQELARRIAAPLGDLLDEPWLEVLEKNPEELLEKILQLARTQESPGAARPDPAPGGARSGPLF